MIDFINLKIKSIQYFIIITVIGILKRFVLITIVILPSNSGSAGAWAYGIFSPPSSIQFTHQTA
jgi:hypothetical protein